MALGVCAGIVSGMLGVGSGTVIIPALALIMHLPQKPAQGMCLAAMIPMVAGDKHQTSCLVFLGVVQGAAIRGYARATAESRARYRARLHVR